MILISLFFVVLPIIAGYISARGVFVITQSLWLSVVLVLLSLTFPMSFGAVQRILKNDLAIKMVSYTGYIYLGFIFYFALFCIGAFIAKKCFDVIDLRRTLSFGLFSVIFVLFLGYLNAMTPKLKHITVPSSDSANLRICFLSDIHVGCIGTETILANVIEKIEKASPDVVIIGGDFIDPIGLQNYREEFLETFSKIASRYRTYAVIGNHEIYSGAEDSIKLIKQAGIHLLLDQIVTIDGFDIVGRLDKTIIDRKKISEIIALQKENNQGKKQLGDDIQKIDSDRNRNLIIVDHAPDSILESVDARAFLHLSGHTHGGQMFPMNLIVNLVYEPTGVLKKIQDTYLYITYGVGYWGPPYRIGNSPEVVLIDIRADTLRKYDKSYGTKFADRKNNRLKNASFAITKKLANNVEGASKAFLNK